MTTPFPGIRAVTFDVGGTLIEPWPSVGHVYAEVAAKHGRGEFAPEVLNQRFAIAWRNQRNFAYTREAWFAIVDETFGDLISKPAGEMFFPALYNRFAEADVWRIFDDVEPTLTGLVDRGIRLGIISNWDERLRPLLATLGLASHFEVITISCEAGATKPSPRIFQTAAQSLGLLPKAILHVGDSAELDVAGAQAAGFQAVRIRRNPTSVRAHEMASLTELLEVVQPNGHG